MTRYMFLIYADPSEATEMTPELWDQMLQAHNAWAASVEEGGCTIVSGEPLAEPSTATSIRHNGSGEPLVTDGPFAETKEVLGGYYLVDAPDLDVALTYARTLPARFVEVRPTIPIG
ncbi:MAG: YciI family protein [Candidatus Nanopelagicales bacterium]